jgi:hypothetical protein
MSYDSSLLLILGTNDCSIVLKVVIQNPQTFCQGMVTNFKTSESLKHRMFDDEII